MSHEQEVQTVNVIMMKNGNEYILEELLPLEVFQVMLGNEGFSPFNTDEGKVYINLKEISEFVTHSK